MSQEDPRSSNRLIRSEVAKPSSLIPIRKASRPPAGSLCSACGGTELSSVPTYSNGSGVASNPFSEDVICLRCSHIGPPVF